MACARQGIIVGTPFATCRRTTITVTATSRHSSTSTPLHITCVGSKHAEQLKARAPPSHPRGEARKAPRASLDRPPRHGP